MKIETQTLSRTRFADRGRQIDTEALHQIYFGVRSSITSLAEQTWETLGVQPPDTVDVEFYVELPGRFAGQLSHALDAVDVAWRIGWMAAEMEEAQLPTSGGSTNLEELLPIERYGLAVEAIEISSLKTRLKDSGVSYDRALATLSMIVALSGFNAQEALLADAEPVGSIPCQVKVVGQLDGEASKAIQDQLPGLPADCLVKAKITLPDESVIYVNVPVDALPDR